MAGVKMIPDRVYREIINQNEDAIILFDASRRILYVNGMFCAVFKTAPDRVIGRGYLDILRAEPGSDADRVDQDLARGEGCSFHGVFFKMKRTGIRAGPFCVSCTHLDLKDQSFNMVVFKDMKPVAQYIERIERVGQVLEKEQDYLNKILDGIADGYYITDLNRRIIRANRKLLNILDEEETDVVGHRCQEIFASGDCETDCPLTWVKTHQKPILNAREIISAGHGEKIPIRKSTFPVLDLENKLTGLICIVHNRSEIENLKKKLAAHGMDFPLVSNNKRMQEIFDLVISMRYTDPYVLLTGESGTGKEVLANSIVENSPRTNSPYLKISCSALPEGLLESDLFGHKRGSFTGAVADKIGKFAFANHGTILLDEIGDMPPALQAKVLRVLENGEFQPVGSTNTEKVDVRIIAATNQELKSRIERGHFREDLFYRLCVVPIEIPPLRERKEDIPSLIWHFISQFNKKYGKRVHDVSARAFAMLMDYDWPGNIRELRNAIEHAFACVQGQHIERVHLPLHIHRSVSPDHDITSPAGIDRKDIDQQKILELLRRFNGNRILTANALHISRTTLWRKMKTLGIQEFH